MRELYLLASVRDDHARLADRHDVRETDEAYRARYRRWLREAASKVANTRPSLSPSIDRLVFED